MCISPMAGEKEKLESVTQALVLGAVRSGADPLAGGLVTLLGQTSRLMGDEECAKARASYLAIHPNASYYIDFGDFSFWKLEVESLRYIGG